LAIIQYHVSNLSSSIDKVKIVLKEEILEKQSITLSKHLKLMKIQKKPTLVLGRLAIKMVTLRGQLVVSVLQSD
jgi:hypothetical protein